MTCPGVSAEEPQHSLALGLCAYAAAPSVDVGSVRKRGGLQKIHSTHRNILVLELHVYSYSILKFQWNAMIVDLVYFIRH